VPFCKTQTNSGDLSATMFLSVFVFSLALTLGLGIYLKSTYAKKTKNTCAPKNDRYSSKSGVSHHPHVPGTWTSVYLRSVVAFGYHRSLSMTLALVR
jgi:hypothetical protein